jgi:DNA-binding NarL/FixJ family response regulator
MTIRVLVADDERLVRAGYRMILRGASDLELTAEAGDGLEAVDVTRRTRPDVVLMDVRMPRLDGIEATRRIASFQDPPAVLVVTTFDLDEYVYRALRAGAAASCSRTRRSLSCWQRSAASTRGRPCSARR